MTDTVNPSTENELARRRRVLELAHDLADLLKDVGERVKEMKDDLLVSPSDIVDLTFGNFSPELQARLQPLAGPLAMNLDIGYHALTESDADHEKNVMSVMQMHSHTLAEHGLGAPGDAMMGDLYRHVQKITAEPNLKRTPMEKLIGRLFAEAPKLTDGKGQEIEGQAPAIECFVVLRGLPQAINGVLSTTPEGMLRMMTPTEIPDPVTKRTKMAMSEQFFEYDDVLCIAVTRDVSASPGVSRLST